MDGLENATEHLVPKVQHLSPHLPWEDVVRVINARVAADHRPWTVERLKRAARRYDRKRLLYPRIMERSTPRHRNERLTAIVAAIAETNPDITLAGIAGRLEVMRELTR